MVNHPGHHGLVGAGGEGVPVGYTHMPAHTPPPLSHTHMTGDEEAGMWQLGMKRSQGWGHLPGQLCSFYPNWLRLAVPGVS